MSEPPRHVSRPSLEQMAEGALPEPEAATIRAHLESCRDCAGELDAYRALYAALESLPRYAPSDRFADAVMARVRLVPQESLVSHWLQRIVPTTRRGWVLVGAIITAPLTPVFALLGLMFVQPLITPTTLWQWAALRSQSVTQGGLGWLTDRVVDFSAWGVVETIYSLTQTIPPGLVAAAAGAVAVAIPFSAWTLLTLTRPPATARMTHAN